MTKQSLPVWLGAGFLVILLAFGGFVIRENYRTAIEKGETQALASAQIVATHAEWMMEASVQALRRIDTALGPDDASSTPGDISNIANAVGDLPTGFTYSVFDETGELRSSSVANPRPLNEKDRAYFQRLQKGERLTIARLQQDPQLGKFAFLIGQRIDRDGVFHGVATITVANDFVDNFWSRMGLGPNSTVTILRDDGWLLARHPEPAESVDLSTTVWFPLLKDSESGLYHSAVSPIDGISRIVAFRKVEGWPIIAMAGIDRHEVLSLFWRNLRSELLFVVPLVIMLAVAFAWIAWLLHRYTRRNDELEAAIERNRFLMREIHHRVKNNLQAVMALVRLQPLPAEARNDMSRRVAAMIAVHEQIYEKDQFEQVEVAPYIQKMVSGIAAAYDKQVTLEINIEPISVDREQALPIGMVVNEVVSNAFKYAFGSDDGTLSVRLGRNGDQAILTIHDTGPGFDIDTSRKGMGSKLITGFVSQLRGTWQYRFEKGTMFELAFPLH